MKRWKVYLAGPYAIRKDLWPVREKLNAIPNFEVTASWLDEPDGLTYETVTDDWLKAQSIVDIDEVKACDVLMVFPGQGAGHHTEFGIAFALDKHCIVVGKRNNIFHHHPNVEWHETLDNFLNSMNELGDNGSLQ